jgi:hypothetical protein
MVAMVGVYFFAMIGWGRFVLIEAAAAVTVLLLAWRLTFLWRASVAVFEDRVTVTRRL